MGNPILQINLVKQIVSDFQSTYAELSEVKDADTFLLKGVTMGINRHELQMIWHGMNLLNEINS